MAIGVAANASFSAAFQGIPTTAVFMRSDYHLGNAELGLVLGLGVALSELPWGLLTDRWGDRRVLLTGLLATSIDLAFMAIFAVPTPFAIPSVLKRSFEMLTVGLLGGSVNGSSGRAVMAWFREGERGFAMSMRKTAVPAGGGLGALALPSISSQFGFASVYGFLALLCMITAVFAWRWLHEPPAVDAPALIKKAAPVSEPFIPNPLRDSRIWRLAIGIGVFVCASICRTDFRCDFLHDHCRAGVVTISVILAIIQLGAAVMRVWSGR